MVDTVSPWWRGLTSDHLYERCPGRLASLPELAVAGWDKSPGLGSLDPEGGDVCGWCLRVWRARNRRESGGPVSLSPRHGPAIQGEAG